jgi:hypothetical protein
VIETISIGRAYSFSRVSLGRLGRARQCDEVYDKVFGKCTIQSLKYKDWFAEGNVIIQCQIPFSVVISLVLCQRENTRFADYL